MFLVLPLILIAFWFYFFVIRELPNISEIEDADFNQTTVITDRNGIELYKLYEENRDYIPFEDISENFVNAIVATEDQRFRDNPGVDRKGIIRAWIADISSGWKSLQWWSTITQQVIKNILLTPEKKITRKLKEIILAVKLVKYVRNDVETKYDWLSGKEIDRKVKEHILELYANYIFLWNNSYGIEIASKTYFWKWAKSLDVLQWAILAGIPQAPSTYNPYTSTGLLMWEVTIKDRNTDQNLENPVEIPSSVRSQVIKDIEQKITDANIENKRDDSRIAKFIGGLLDYNISIWWKDYAVKYVPGRKDSVLARMYEMWYISASDRKEAFIWAFDYEFNREPVAIKAPHFVFWVINQLEEEYDEEVLRTWGLQIKTSLDYDIQQLAEASIRDNWRHYTSYEAYNAWLVYLDSLNGDVLAYVWSKDYNNEDIEGQVDMVQARRQPWSTIKPLVYSLGFTNMKLTIDSPIYDVPMTIGNNTPQNADGEFRWLTTIRKALAGSRNIPAIKMFMSVGWEKVIKNFLSDIWFTNLVMNQDYYWYSLGLWAAETPMLELANGYSHLSAMGKPAEINPIMEVRWSDGSILYQKDVELQEQIIPSWVSYLMWNMLSDKDNFPEDWRANFTIPGIDIATKSGTTNVIKGETKLPRDWWLATYTPSKVLVMRWWNTDGSPMRYDAYGWWLNSPAWKSFLTKMKNQQYLKNETMEQVDVEKVNISKLSWKLSSVSTPLVFIKQSLWYIHSLPTEYDNQVSSYQIDTLCNGKPSDLTPSDALWSAWYIRPQTMMPGDYDQEDVLTRWRNGGAASFWNSWYFSLNPWPSQECEERVAIKELWEISMELMQPSEWQSITRNFSFWHQTSSPFTITDMKLYLWDIELQTINYNKAWPLVDIRDITLPSEIEDGTYVFKAVIWDEKWYSDSRSVKLKVGSKASDTIPPFLIEDKIKVIPNDDGSFRIVLLFGDEASSVKDGKIFAWWSVVHSFDGNVADFSIKQISNLTYEAFDTSENKVEGSIVLQAPAVEKAPEEPAPSPVEEKKEEPVPVVEEAPVEEKKEEPAPVVEEAPVESDPWSAANLNEDEIAAAVDQLLQNTWQWQ